MSFQDIKISFDKNSRNSGIVSFKMKNSDQEKIELIILYESVRLVLNGGWFIYDYQDEEFWCFNPRFYVFDRKIENETSSFCIEVSLTNFESMGKYNAMFQVEKIYTPEIEQRFREEFNL